MINLLAFTPTGANTKNWMKICFVLVREAFPSTKLLADIPPLSAFYAGLDVPQKPGVFLAAHPNLFLNQTNRIFTTGCAAQKRI